MVELGVERFGRLGVGWLSWVLSGWAVGCSVFELGVGRLGGWAVWAVWAVGWLSWVLGGLGGWVLGR